MLGMAPARRVIRGGCLGFLIRVILRPSAVGFWSFVRRFAVPFLCFLRLFAAINAFVFPLRLGVLGRHS
jgi:hypothetical protein